MRRITVNQKEVDKRFDEGSLFVITIDNCVIVDWDYNGWHIVENSACVYPEKFDKKIGMDICIEKIKIEFGRCWDMNCFLKRIFMVIDNVRPIIYKFRFCRLYTFCNTCGACNYYLQ